MDLTILELNVSDAEFYAPFAGASGSTAEDDETADDSSGPWLGPLAALLAFAGLALLARYLRGGEAEQATLDEVEA